MKTTSSLNATLAAALLTGTVALGQGSDAILDLLIKKGVINQREANEAREQMDRQTAETVEMYSKTKTSSWLDSLTFSGDLRLRTEYFDFEKNPTTGLKLTQDRMRFRYRLRFGVEAKYRDWATVNLRLASGEASPGDPVSVNQSFNTLWQKKPINIDVASVTIAPPSWDWLKVTAGKMDLPIWQPKFNSPMVYDFDDTPEGIAEQLQWKLGDNQQYRLFAGLGQFVLKEFSSASAGGARDMYLFDQQAGIEAKFGADPKNPVLKTTLVGGFYTTHNLDKQGVPAENTNKGNSYKPGAVSTNVADFGVLYVRGEAGWNIRPEPFLGTPCALTLSGEYDKNIRDAFKSLADPQTEGWTLQAAFGEAKKKGQWMVAYQYKHLEADAVWDAITDSDWGAGGTDRKGHVFKAAYNPLDWWQLGFTAFISEKISSQTARPSGTGHNIAGFPGENLLRIQADSVFKF